VQGLKTVKNTLPNGLMALVTENHATPVCSVTISIKGGLRAEAQKNNGISNLTALAMLKGAAGYKKDEIAELIDSLGAQLSPYAGNNSFGFSANFRSKDLEKLLDVLSSIIIAPTFPQDEIDILKNDILAQIQLDYDDIFKHTGISLRKNLFKSHPYGLIAIGTKESVANITRDDLIAFHKNFCVSKNVVVSICGDINNEKAHEIIKDKFGKMPQGEIFNVEQLNLDTANPPTQTIEPMEKKQAVVMIGFKGASLYNNDRYPLQVLSSLFSDGGGRLYSQIRQKEGLAYTLGTFGMVGLDTGAFIFYAATAPGYANQVGESIINQIQQISNGNITDEEINAAKKSLITKYQLGLQSNEAFAMQTGLDELYGFGYDYHTRYSELVTSVSKKDLIVVAKKYFKLDKSATVTTLPAQYIKR
jgi:zinc protease